MALAHLVGLVLYDAAREARHDRRLASARLSTLLEVEVPTSWEPPAVQVTSKSRVRAARATFRGVDPQDVLSVRAVAGLKEDGPIPDGRPTAIAASDVTGATHIFAIGCALPASATQSGKANSREDVPTTRVTARCEIASGAMCAS